MRKRKDPGLSIGVFSVPQYWLDMRELNSKAAKEDRGLLDVLRLDYVV